VTASERWLRLLIGKPAKVEKAKANVLRLQNPHYARAVIVVSVLAGALVMGAGLAFTLEQYVLAGGLLAVALAATTAWVFVISNRVWNSASRQRDLH
jgi:hypothetical protein